MVLNERTFANQLETLYSESKTYWEKPGHKYYDILVNKILLEPLNIRNMVKMCEMGRPPLEAVACQIERIIAIEMKDERVLRDNSWKQNVGKLVATVVSFFDYYPVKGEGGENVQVDIQNVPRPKEFHFSSLYHFKPY